MEVWLVIGGLAAGCIGGMYLGQRYLHKKERAFYAKYSKVALVDPEKFQKLAEKLQALSDEQLWNEFQNLLKPRNA